MAKIEETISKKEFLEMEEFYKGQIVLYQKAAAILIAIVNSQKNTIQQGMENMHGVLVERDAARSESDAFIERLKTRKILFPPREPDLHWRKKGGPEAWYQYYLDCRNAGVTITHRMIANWNGIAKQTVTNRFAIIEKSVV